MKKIEPEFEKIRELAPDLLTINKNALDDDYRGGIIAEIADHIGGGADWIGPSFYRFG